MNSITLHGRTFSLSPLTLGDLRRLEPALLGAEQKIADWPHLFGYIATSTGWTIPEIELLTLRQANELLEYWNEHPPAHVLLAAMMRARPLRKKRTSSDLLSAVAGAGGRVSTQASGSIKDLLKFEHGGHGGHRGENS
jgi:hypothetical protein